jgi:hypothetical protein
LVNSSIESVGEHYMECTTAILRVFALIELSAGSGYTTPHQGGPHAQYCGVTTGTALPTPVTGGSHGLAGPCGPLMNAPQGSYTGAHRSAGSRNNLFPGVGQPCRDGPNG